MSGTPGSRVGPRPGPLDLEPVDAPAHVRALTAGSVWYADRRRGLTVSVNAHGPGGWHLSISGRGRYPSWDEIVKARYAKVPDDVTMALLLPPRAEWVNAHETCFHLHQVPGETGQ